LTAVGLVWTVRGETLLNSSDSYGLVSKELTNERTKKRHIQRATNRRTVLKHRQNIASLKERHNQKSEDTKERQN